MRGRKIPFRDGLQDIIDHRQTSENSRFAFVLFTMEDIHPLNRLPCSNEAGLSSIPGGETPRLDFADSPPLYYPYRSGTLIPHRQGAGSTRNQW